MKKKIAPIIWMIIIATILSGCWSRKELNEVAIVLGTGIDLINEGRVRLTVQVAVPTAFASGEEGKGGQKEAASMEVSADGATIEEAERYLAMKIPREIYWGHCVALIIGENMAKKGVRMITDFFERDREPRETMWVMVAKGTAEDFLKTSSILEKTSSQAVGLLTRMKTGYSVKLMEFTEMLAEDGIQPAVTGVKVINEHHVTGESQQSGAGNKRRVEISGTALFREDRLVGWLDANETRGLLWLKGEPVEGVITVPAPEEPNKMVSIKIKRGSTKKYAGHFNDAPYFTVKIRVEGDMVEQQGRENLATPERMNALEEKMAYEIRKRAELALYRARDIYGVDVFGFGQVYHRRFKSEWRNIKDSWDDIFRQAKVDIQVEAHIREIGLLTRRPGTEK
ncbi:Ger(x)C family spore germination protein [Biomaibacter acetigenes]|uniref:Ger(X)C family spore germination protein n=1 Tax=Biomaibacter acetigenes TaxID=2316383 RepID=A0A3G2R2R9_9FIRM|nr:Ger(x)C family spore germination protein [Biomaibacter acetigenes]AYO29605.1 Ger(x)C family spore germination protein [Biomaibacter acetigenes]RKL61672.1 Ger(x)C family spore germination protein [Thermoanaerobacteraceae bacterium SP2]